MVPIIQPYLESQLLDSMGSLSSFSSQEQGESQGIKSMQVYSWKRMECTRRLARFIEFNFSDQHAICLNSRKREFEGSCNTLT